MYNLKADEIRLIKKYNHDLDGLVDVVKVLCHDAYNKGLEDGYDQGFDECRYIAEQANKEKH